MRERLLADPQLVDAGAREIPIKNTTGYRLCALLDAETPLEIFRRLIVGSEGTLAFVASAVMRTRPEPRHKAVALAALPDDRRGDGAGAAAGRSRRARRPS